MFMKCPPLFIHSPLSPLSRCHSSLLPDPSSPSHPFHTAPPSALPPQGHHGV